MRIRVRTGANLGEIIAAAIAQGVRRPRPRAGGGAQGEPCPVKPDRPLTLSGGAAAALEFDA